MVYIKIQKAIDSGLFSESMCEIVAPLSEKEISDVISKLNVLVSNEHLDLLREWGGSNIDEIRIHGLNDVFQEESYIVFANDYNGYRFAYDHDGSVFAIDSDGGMIQNLGNSVAEFINEFLLGEKGRDFYGEAWVKELRIHGIV